MNSHLENKNVPTFGKNKQVFRKRRRVSCLSEMSVLRKHWMTFFIFPAF